MVRGVWSLEKHRCKASYEYYASHYLKIQSRKRIASQMLTWNVVQRILWKKMVDQKRRTGKIRQIWGKPRKIGATTLVRGMSFWLTSLRPHRRSLLLTHDEPSCMEVFAAQDLAFYRGLPPAMRPPSNYQSRMRLSFNHLDSEVTAGHARDMNIGVTQTYDFIHASEVPRFRNAETIMQDALFPTLSEATAFDDNDWDCSVAVLEGTSKHGGSGKWFKDFAEAARRGENEYEFTFIPAYIHEDYQLPVPERFKLTVAERALMKQHNLPVTHMVWRRIEQAKYAKNPSLFRQNYPLTWEESWVLPTGTERVLSDAMLESLERGLKPGTRMAIDDRGLHDMLGGPLEVWERPVSGVYYDFGLDIASGKGCEGDKTVLEVIRRDTLEQVAECVTAIDPASKEFEDLIYWTGMVYNGAQLVPDITGGWGWALLSALQRRNYPSIWQPRRRDDVQERVSSKLGFQYTAQSKMELVNNMLVLVTQRYPVIHSVYLYNEMVTYIEVEQGKWDASPGSNDDAINAYMLALMGSYDEDGGTGVIEALPDEAKERIAAKKSWVPEEKGFDFEEELRRGERVQQFGNGGQRWV